MEFRQFGRTDLKVSAIGFGCWEIGGTYGLRERVTEIERPDWWPTDEEVRAALRPEAAVSRG